ncbi:MAG: alkaline phosphatase D family protein [Bacteroidia bacterium]|nr:alkaline phosphatase D family protein [Bacteroidia bacterium]MDW8133796.1 alkaline phosphatase D family protein [Bacteroidia bacterium]
MRIAFTLVLTIIWAQSPTHPARAQARSNQAPFLHGVASGDPLTDRVILWTRITPPQNWTSSVSVSWEVAADVQFTQIVASGITSTDASRDYTVKIDATGLQPGQWYYYRFRAFNTYSPIGRTRTLPVGTANRLRIAVASCADYQNGFYTAYENITRRNDIDLVIHLGDYIYEYGPSQNSVRQAEPPQEILTLNDYRIRYSHYRLDSSLQWLHQNYPMIGVWDDHELADNAWKAGAANHDPNTEGPFQNRRIAMLQAYQEWLPFRLPDFSSSDSLRIWRSFRWGNLAEIILIDTRHYARDEQVRGNPLNVNDPNLNNPNRTMLGATQLSWLSQQLTSSPSTWKLIGQQVMIAPLRVSLLGNTYIVNSDQWDGYPAERQRLMDTIIRNNIQNVAFLTGDIHTSWANDLPFGPGTYDPSTGAGSTAVEFVTPSITSANASFIGNLGNPTIISQANPHVKYVNLTQHGYLVLDVTDQQVQGDWYFVNTITQPQSGETQGESWYVRRGERFLRRANAPVLAPNYNPPLIPRSSATSLVTPSPTLIGVYPNPAQNFITLQLYTPQPQTLSIYLTTLGGQMVESYTLTLPSTGTHYYQVPLDKIAQGAFILTVEDKKGTKSSYYLLKQ